LPCLPPYHPTSTGRHAHQAQDRLGPLRRLGGPPGEAVSLASWLPLRPGLTPHGLRHGHQTWLDDLGVRYVLQSERMGHEVPGMRGVYSNITPRMRAGLRDGLQQLWEASLYERALLTERSAVAILDRLLTRR
jgi:integrase